ncbi:MAG: glycosyltransferase [Propionibacterium sp.]|nr:glycosyltransferase [Propionibacterium sp.]
MKLSVVVPAYNVEAHISRTLDSIVAQQQPVHEIIVIDDGSTDGTRQVVDEYFRRRPTPGLTVRGQENRGVSAARNAGLDLATGDYVLFLDADDLIDPSLAARLGSVVDARAVAADAVVWRFDQLDAQGTRMNRYDRYWKNEIPESSTGAETLHRILRARKQWIWTGSIAWRVDFLRERGLRFTEGCRHGQDLEFNWTSLSRATSVLAVNEVLSWYVIRPGSTTNVMNPKRFDDVRAFQRTADAFAASPDQLVQELSADVQRMVFPHFWETFAKMARTTTPAHRILSQIRTGQPGLLRDMRSIIVASLVRRESVPRKHAVFAVSPSAYIRYVRRAKSHR